MSTLYGYMASTVVQYLHYFTLYPTLYTCLPIALLRQMHLPPHWLKDRFLRPSARTHTAQLRFHSLSNLPTGSWHLDLISHLVQEVYHRLCMPSLATISKFKPRQMPTERGGAEDCVWILLEFLVRDGFAYCDLGPD